MVVQSSVSFPLTSTASGSGYIFISPDYASANAATTLSECFAAGNPTTFDPSTGTSTGT